MANEIGVSTIPVSEVLAFLACEAVDTFLFSFTVKNMPPSARFMLDSPFAKMWTLCGRLRIAFKD